MTQFERLTLHGMMLMLAWMAKRSSPSPQWTDQVTRWQIAVMGLHEQGERPKDGQ